MRRPGCRSRCAPTGTAARPEWDCAGSYFPLANPSDAQVVDVPFVASLTKPLSKTNFVLVFLAALLLGPAFRWRCCMPASGMRPRF
ncbi:hypothetical protein BZL30_9409, partial [Mycobacterium kansasii]